MNYNLYLIISSLVLLIPRTQGKTSFIAKIFSATASNIFYYLSMEPHVNLNVRLSKFDNLKS